MKNTRAWANPKRHNCVLKIGILNRKLCHGMEAYRWSCMCHRYVMLMCHGYAMDGSCIGYRCLGIGHGEEKQTTKHCTNLDQKLTIIGSTPKLKSLPTIL